MKDEEGCTICLEQLFGKNKLISRLQPCGHYYHIECMNLWRDKSNSCPTCRGDYDIIERVDCKGEVCGSLIAEKKQIEVVEEFFESLDDVGSDYDEYDGDTMLLENDLDHRVDHRIDVLIGRSNICVLCDARSNRLIITCDVCCSNFHPNCLGIAHSGVYSCPMCDSGSLVHNNVFNSRRISRNSETTNRVYMSTGRHFVAQLQQQKEFEPAMTESVVERSPLTLEEQNAWKDFELIRSGAGASSSAARHTPSTDRTPTRKQKPPSRRKKRS